MSIFAFVDFTIAASSSLASPLGTTFLSLASTLFILMAKMTNIPTNADMTTTTCHPLRKKSSSILVIELQLSTKLPTKLSVKAT